MWPGAAVRTVTLAVMRTMTVTAMRTMTVTAMRAVVPGGAHGVTRPDICAIADQSRASRAGDVEVGVAD
jgi:hypothetical protein